VPEKPTIYGVESSEIVDVGEVARALHDMIESHAGGLEHFPYMFKGQMGLRFDGPALHLTGGNVERPRAADIQLAVNQNTRRVCPNRDFLVGMENFCFGHLIIPR
jgi:hypothetical protein